MTDTATNYLADMVATSRQLQEELEVLSALAADRVAAEHAYRMAYDSAYLACEGSIPERQSRASMQTSELRRTFDTARAKEQTAKERIHSWRAILSALQTAAGAAREEARFARVGPQA
jgi:hypothetical protein